MLGTHSEPRRGETSHICDISLLRVKDFMNLSIVKTFVSVEHDLSGLEPGPSLPVCCNMYRLGLQANCILYIQRHKSVFFDYFTLVSHC